MKVDYNKIYEYLGSISGKVATPSQIAYFTNHERLYGATMSKLVRDGYLKPCAEKGFYRVV